MNKIKVIAFDADDTLWINETFFREAEKEFAKLLSGYETENKIHQELYKKEIDNLKIYGYGVKGFVLSMVECALELSNYKVNQKIIDKILGIGKEMLAQPIDLLDGVEEVLQELQGKCKIIVATKGDLLDQERKLEKSGILKYFHHTEVMSDKKPADYLKLIKHLDIQPSELLMIGNSLKSDVLPLIEIGAAAIHVPFHTTWAHEQVKGNQKSTEYQTVSNITEVLNFL
ncbi:HAD family hydrolase [Tenacibaculum finnmarkense genomovar finnmarkense]|uniref:HAD family hydrolase n=1 Tax=Tenacibaculum finnmarkense TaxID=2781243 RepID=UPI001E2CD7D0|nr:HAD family hydrolase [Tenacibaculum finnmarkense]MCD8402493.1 HAD family hydrolase [Tenacibaculum finnmarkense genomovar finnmarkense]MCD8418467.1 HAD family hydrolase [Tenacibaculum finnmarkense genomovar finnmarkense]MCG8186842.1 HAD family hydrolase [Tenacibaculum finnmarkense genomovar finnmarkense]MCG8203356.1 HAD family hydrolase [Tenacibaculum finnmarkense genomovar finnmarkense]MCG8210832.1 HAD family hydrolase [Tenacibaculum finnmarkense genomovar finnmarkense]